MAKMAKLAVLAVVITVLAGGCQKAGKREVSEIAVGGAWERKTELLNQIEAKYENPAAHYELGKLYQADGLWDKAEWPWGLTQSTGRLRRQ